MMLNLQNVLVTCFSIYKLTILQTDTEVSLLHYEKCRISLLAYSPMAMGILSGKYYSSDDGGPPDARMNLFKGLNSEVAHTTCIFISVLHHSIIIVPPAFQGDTLRVNPDIIFRTPK